MYLPRSVHRSSIRLALATLCLFSSVSRADVIVGASVMQVGPEFSYAYSVENTGTASILGFFVTVDASVDQVSAPNGWEFGTLAIGPQTIVQWLSSDAQFDIPPGQTLPGFVIMSTAPPGSAQYSALDDSFNFFNGQTIGPQAPIPEPSGLTCVGSGLLLMVRVLNGKRSISK